MMQFTPNREDMHRMVRAFTQIHFKDQWGRHAEDGIGPNRPDAPFFEKIAKRSSIDQVEYVELARRLRKYRKTQLPTIMEIAGYSLDTDWEAALDHIHTLGVKAQKVKKEKNAFKSEVFQLWIKTEHPIDDPALQTLIAHITQYFNAKFAQECVAEANDARLRMEESLRNSNTATFTPYVEVWYGSNDRSRRWPRENKNIKIEFPVRHQAFYQFFKESMPFPEFKWDRNNRCMAIKNTKATINLFFEVLTNYEAQYVEGVGGANKNKLYCDSLMELYDDAENDIVSDDTYYTAEKFGSDVLIFLPKTAGELRTLVKQHDGKWKREKIGWILPLSKVGDFISDLEYELEDDRNNGNDTYEGGFFHIEEDNCLQLIESIMGIDEVANYVQSKVERIKLSGSVKIDDADVVREMEERLAKIFPVGHQLYPFQYTGVRYAEISGGRCLIGDDMGIGKTIQALAYIALHPELHPVLVCCPANVKYNWLKEANIWVGSTYTSSIVDKGTSEVEDTDIVIINYDIVNKQKDTLLARGFNTIICDESHYLKNHMAARTKATLEIADKCESVLFLSGTAITNRPKELWTTLTTLRPTEWRGKFMEYAKKYCAAYHNGWGWDFTGSSNEGELHALLRDFMIRRMKKEVMEELPDKIRQYPHITPNPTMIRKYIKTQKETIHSLNSVHNNKSAAALVALTRLRHECGLMKIDAAVDWVVEYLSNNDRPIIVFTHHKDVLQGIKEELEQAHTKKKFKDLIDSPIGIEVITGDVHAKVRQVIVEKFQALETDVLLATTPAAKEGLTLTAADTVVFVEREWSPAHEEQAEDRVNRIGQDASTVWAVYLTVPSTIDEKFNNVIETKRVSIKSILDGGEIGKRNSIVFDLLNEMVESGDVDAKVLEGF
jgi:superfamily II DNA or RNA helicase